MGVNLTRFELCAGEVVVIDCIRPELGFQTERTETGIGFVAFAHRGSIEPVAHIELDSRLVGIDRECDSCAV